MPNFLGVGFYRCGSTWLHDLLDAHPRCFVPQEFKELHYFLPHVIGRGRGWYESFFPDDVGGYDAVGEVGPGYGEKGGLDAIAADPTLGSEGRFIFIARNHADMLLSEHDQRTLTRPDQPPFGDATMLAACRERPLRFSGVVQPWLDRFGGDRVLLLTLEQVKRDLPGTREVIAHHLGLDPTLFPDDAGRGSSNVSGTPRFAVAYRLAARANVWLVRRGLHRLSGRLRDAGLKRLFGFKPRDRTASPLTDDLRRQIAQVYAEDRRRMKGQGFDLTGWDGEPA